MDTVMSLHGKNFNGAYWGQTAKVLAQNAFVIPVGLNGPGLLAFFNFKHDMPNSLVRPLSERSHTREGFLTTYATTTFSISFFVASTPASLSKYFSSLVYILISPPSYSILTQPL